MQRYLRRHVARDSGHWVRQFMASCDPVEIAQLMRSSRAALLVFGEMLWARTLEPDVSRRRWPYREDATQDGRVGHSGGTWCCEGSRLKPDLCS